MIAEMSTFRGSSGDSPTALAMAGCSTGGNGVGSGSGFGAGMKVRRLIGRRSFIARAYQGRRFRPVPDYGPTGSPNSGRWMRWVWSGEAQTAGKQSKRLYEL